MTEITIYPQHNKENELAEEMAKFFKNEKDVDVVPSEKKSPTVASIDIFFPLVLFASGATAKWAIGKFLDFILNKIKEFKKNNKDSLKDRDVYISVPITVNKSNEVNMQLHIYGVAEKVIGEIKKIEFN